MPLYCCLLPKEAQFTALTRRREAKICMQILLAELVTQAEKIQASISY